MENKITAASELAKTIIANTYHSHVGNNGYDQRPYIVGEGYINGVAGYAGFADGRPDQEWEANSDDVLRQIEEMKVGQCLVLPDYSGCHHDGDSVFLKADRKGGFCLLDGVDAANPHRLFGDRFLKSGSGFEIIQIVGQHDDARYKTGERSYLRTVCSPDGFVGVIEGLRENFDIYEVEITDYGRDPQEILNY